METLETSKLFKPALDRGKRCVIPIEGFYEWQTVNSKLKSSERPVYYIYMPQRLDVKIENNSTWKCDDVKLMYLAGLFDVWNDEEGDSIFSYTVLTYESDKHLSWLHHRTPAILETEEQVSDWLNFEKVPAHLSLKVIKHPTTIVWHQVSNYVNNSRNKSELCNKPRSESKSGASQKNLLSWVKKRTDEPKEKSEEKSPKRAKHN